MASTLSTTNYSILGLPIFYAICILPHGYAINLASKGNLAEWDNRNPRASTLKENLSKALGPEKYARYERAEAAHYNGLEAFAYVSAAVLAGNLARLPTEELNQLILSAGALRLAYNIAYIATTNNALSYIRSGLYAGGLGLAFRTLWRAGKALQ